MLPSLTQLKGFLFFVYSHIINFYRNKNVPNKTGNVKAKRENRYNTKQSYPTIRKNTWLASLLASAGKPPRSPMLGVYYTPNMNYGMNMLSTDVTNMSG